MPLGEFHLLPGATPERETHGAFARAVATALPFGAALHLVVDRGAYRQRLASLPEAAGRLAQRAQAWEAMCAALQLPAPRFIDLASTAAAAAPARPA